jgi:hypothetical protein
MDSWSAHDALQIEAVLRSRLRGLNFIGELDLEPSSETYLQAESVIRPLLNRGKFRTVPQFPASLSIFLVARGRHAYEQGSFWDKLGLDEELSAPHQTSVGENFIKSLDILGLESFSGVTKQLNALKFLTPILLHGGIPEDSAESIWVALATELKKGIYDSHDLQSRIGVNGVVNYLLSKPARRFITFGGDYSRDLLARMIDVCESFAPSEIREKDAASIEELSRTAGLPNYLFRRFSALENRIPRKAQRIARPQVTIDPYGGEGPYLKIPIIGPDLPEVLFRVGGGDSKVIRGSTFEPAEIPMSNTGPWKVDCEYGQISRTWDFSGVPNGRAFLFDSATGALLRNQRDVADSQVLVLVEKGVRPIDAGSELEIPIIEICADLSSAWRMWELLRVDLSSQTTFKIPFPGQPPNEATSISVDSREPVVQNTSLPLQGLTGRNGRHVYNRIPTISVSPSININAHHRLRWRDREGVWKELPGNPVDELGNLQLAELISPDGFFDGEIVFQGPLGSDFRESLLIFPGLSVNIPEKPILTSTPTVVDVVVESLDNFSAPGLLDSLIFGPDEIRKDLVIADGSILTVSLPRVSWSIRSAGELSGLNTKLVKLSSEEIVQGKVESIVVKTGVAAQISLELSSGNTAVRSLPPVTTSRDGGRWTFPMAQFVDDINHSDQAAIKIRLRVGNELVDVADIVASYTATQIRALVMETETDACESVAIDVEWTENKKFSNRIIRLWSMARPWEAPFEHEIPDGSEPMAHLIIESRLVYGRALMEISLKDEWRVSRRPSLNAPNAAEVILGNIKLLRKRRDRLDPTNFLNRLELLMSGQSGFLNGATSSEIDEYSNEVCAVFELIASDAIAGLPMDYRSFDELMGVVAKDFSTLATIVAKFQETFPLRFNEFVLNLIPRLKKFDQIGLVPDVREQFWKISPLLGGALDATSHYPTSDSLLWCKYTSWPHQIDDFYSDEDEVNYSEWRLPFKGAINRQLSSISFSDLKAMLPHMAPMPLSAQLPLANGGFFEAVFELLTVIQEEPDWCSKFIENSGAFAQAPFLSDQEVRQFVTDHTPEQMSEPHAAVPKLLLTMSLLLLKGGEVGDDCIPQLIKAYLRIPLFVKRSILLACALKVLEKEANYVK